MEDGIKKILASLNDGQITVAQAHEQVLSIIASNNAYVTEKAKQEATKRIKVVVDSCIHEYEKAIKNGRCKECSEVLSFAEAKNKTCEECLCGG